MFIWKQHQWRQLQSERFIRIIIFIIILLCNSRFLDFLNYLVLVDFLLIGIYENDEQMTHWYSIEPKINLKLYKHLYGNLCRHEFHVFIWKGVFLCGNKNHFECRLSFFLGGMLLTKNNWFNLRLSLLLFSERNQIYHSFF